MIKAALISDPVFFSSPLFQNFAQVLLLVFYVIFIFLFLFLLLLAERRSLFALVKFAKKCSRIG